jgi:hypothetical protein
MFVVYLLWVTFVVGGAFMGISAIGLLAQQGFDVGIFLNAVVFLGIALYGVPKLYKFVFKRG